MMARVMMMVVVVVVGGEIYFREGWLSFLSRGGSVWNVLPLSYSERFLRFSCRREGEWLEIWSGGLLLSED